MLALYANPDSAVASLQHCLGGARVRGELPDGVGMSDVSDGGKRGRMVRPQAEWGGVL